MRLSRPKGLAGRGVQREVVGGFDARSGRGERRAVEAGVVEQPELQLRGHGLRRQLQPFC